MRIIKTLIAGSFLLLANNSFAEYFCVSNHGKPQHCEQGDIVLVKPTMMPRVCDFDAQIVRMPKSENKAEYLCRYTGTILTVKELVSRHPPPVNPNQRMQPPPKKKSKNPFDTMPFFK